MASAQPGTASEAEQKKRRACDECRTRKLACSKESDGCRRCRREDIACIYSAQKQMGRPRKRPRSDSADADRTLGAGKSAGRRINDASTHTPSSTINQGDVGLFMLADQSSSPTELSFFDFLGVGGDGTNNDSTNNDDSNSNLDSFLQQPNHLQTSSTTSSVPPISSTPGMSSMTGLVAPSGEESSTQGHTGLFTQLLPVNLFGVNYSNFDFSTSSIGSVEGGMPDLVIPNPTQAQAQAQHQHQQYQHQHQAQHPQQRQHVSTSASNRRSGVMSPTASMTASAVSQTSASSSPAMNPNTVPASASASGRPTLTPTMQSSSPSGSMSGHHRFSVFPSSPKPDPMSDSTPGQAQPQPKPMSTPSNFLSTTSTVDAYSKASAAWLLTAPNRVCGCLARLYLALDSLQHLPTQMGPAMSVARNAAHTAHDTILCPSCSPENVPDMNYRSPTQSSYQNLMVLGALLPSLAHTYRRIVAMVDEEAARASAAKIRLTISLTEYGGVWGQLARWDNVNSQTNNLDNSIVDPPLWRLVVRALLKMDVYGIHLDRADVDADNGTDGYKEGLLRTDGKYGCFASSSNSAPAEAHTGTNKEGSQHVMVPVHYGLKDIAEMMETRARMRYQWMDADYNAGLLKDTDGFGERLQPGEQYNCQRIFELAKHEIDQLVIV